MELNFQFATASKIIFGSGVAHDLPELLKPHGNKILLVTGQDSWRHEFMHESFNHEGIEVTPFQVSKEPDTTQIVEGSALCRENKCQVVVGLGGGSALDAAKAIAAFTPNKGKLIDYLEVIGKGRRLIHEPLAFIAIPTTAGTGAEVTKNAVILSPEHHVKVSLRSDLMFPRVAVIDPELSLSMPPSITAQTGIDALTHLLESFVSNQSNHFIDMVCREGMKRISNSLLLAFNDGGNLQARIDMAYAAMLGGMALANVKLGAIHGIAGPLGGLIPAPHGMICASLLPAVMKVNVEAVVAQKQARYIEKYNEVAQILTGAPHSKAMDGIDWIKHLTATLQIPTLSSLGLSESLHNELTGKAKKASSMRGNPVDLTDEQLREILIISG